MKTFNTLMTEGKIAQENLPSFITITDRLWNSGFSDAIGALQQRSAKDDQIIFSANSYDYNEFGKSLKDGEVLIRLSTPLSKNGSSEHKSIAKLNLKLGKLTFVDNDAYLEGTLKWERPYKLKYLTLDSNFLDYFNVW